MSGYIGTQPIPRASRILTQGALSTDTQTINVPGGYNPGNIFVYLDGARLRSSDFDDSSGTTVDLLEVFPTGTEYIVEEIRSFEIPNHYTKTEIQDASFDFNNMPTVGGDPIVESGSNSDGYYEKRASGAVSQTGVIPLTSNDNSGTEFTMPIALVGTDKVAVLVQGTGISSTGLGSFRNVESALVSNTIFRAKCLVVQDGGSIVDTSVNARFLIEGYWK